MPSPILLTVDDDPEVSRSLARDLRQQYGEDYRIRRAESARTTSAPVAEKRLGAGRNVAMMVVGGAALIIGAVIGGTAGVLIAVAGAAIGLYGLYNFVQ